MFEAICDRQKQYNTFYLFVELTHKNKQKRKYLRTINIIQNQQIHIYMDQLPIVQNVVSFAKMQIEEDIDLKLIA